MIETTVLLEEPGGTHTWSRRVSPADTASSASQIASMCQPCT